MGQLPDWNKIQTEGDSFQVPTILPPELKDTILKVRSYVEIVRNGLNVLLTAFQAISAIIPSNISPLSVGINVIIQQVQKMLVDLQNAGFSFLWIEPQSGGINGFVSILEQSLNDQGDEERPQFSEQAAVGGFVLLAGTNFLPDLPDLQYVVYCTPHKHLYDKANKEAYRQATAEATDPKNNIPVDKAGDYVKQRIPELIAQILAADPENDSKKAYTLKDIILEKIDPDAEGDLGYICPLDNKRYNTGTQAISADNVVDLEDMKLQFTANYVTMVRAINTLSNLFAPPKEKQKKAAESESKLMSATEQELQNDPYFKRAGINVNSFLKAMVRDARKELGSTFISPFSEYAGQISLGQGEMNDFEIFNDNYHSSYLLRIYNADRSSVYTTGTQVAFNYGEDPVRDVRTILTSQAIAGNTEVTLTYPVEKTYARAFKDILNVGFTTTAEINPWEIVQDQTSGQKNVLEITGDKSGVYKIDVTFNIDNQETLTVEKCSFDDNNNTTNVYLKTQATKLYSSKRNVIYIGSTATGSAAPSAQGANKVNQNIPSIPPDWSTFSLLDLFEVAEADAGKYPLIGRIRLLLNNIIKMLGNINQGQQKITQAINLFIQMLEDRVTQLTALLDKLLVEIGDFTLDLSLSGFYLLLIDPKAGGTTKFIDTLKASLVDVDDKNRPQFTNKAFLTGVVGIIGYPDAAQAQLLWDTTIKPFFTVQIPAQVDQAGKQFEQITTQLDQQSKDLTKQFEKLNSGQS